MDISFDTKLQNFLESFDNPDNIQKRSNSLATLHSQISTSISSRDITATSDEVMTSENGVDVDSYQFLDVLVPCPDELFQLEPLKYVSKNKIAARRFKPSFTGDTTSSRSSDDASNPPLSSQRLNCEEVELGESLDHLVDAKADTRLNARADFIGKIGYLNVADYLIKKNAGLSSAGLDRTAKSCTLPGNYREPGCRDNNNEDGNTGEDIESKATRNSTGPSWSALSNFKRTFSKRNINRAVNRLTDRFNKLTNSKQVDDDDDDGDGGKFWQREATMSDGVSTNCNSAGCREKNVAGYRMLGINKSSNKIADRAEGRSKIEMFAEVTETSKIDVVPADAGRKKAKKK